MNGDPSTEDLMRMWQEHDPAPPGLAERVLVAVAMDDLDVEYELLEMVASTSGELAGSRRSAAADAALTVSFTNERCSLLLRVSPVGPGERRLDGWIHLTQEELRTPVTVTLLHRDANRELSVTADEHGRFDVPSIGSGLVRILLDVPDEQGECSRGGAVFATPVFEL